MIRVAVSGAAGRMGLTSCAAVQAAHDLELVARIDPSLGVGLQEALAAQHPDVLVEFSVPNAALANIRTAVAAGVHVVVGTTGFALGELRGLDGANVFIAPNFAIGAVLLMRFAAEAARYMAGAEIIELHHDEKLDKPSGTAVRTAELMHAATPHKPLTPIHSVRLPGLVAHQEVIFGDLGQTLTIRHDSMSRESFMPGVLLAVRSVANLKQRLTVGLEELL
ncbi:MAG: 4-hydroxy-tetrahydrodipicolinate reductase [Solirubrobacteraceae bacterium]